MRYVTITTVALAFLFSFVACDDEGTTSPPLLDLTTPVKTLEAVANAFNDRDLDALTLCLADNFTFYFEEGDWTDPGDYVIPDSWGKEKFLEVAGKMFAEAYDIQMEINTSNVGTPDEDDTIYFAMDVEVRLLVMVDATNGYLADGVCSFDFVDSGSGAPDNWVILNWWDYTSPTGSGGRNVEDASIGFILSIFE